MLYQSTSVGFGYGLCRRRCFPEVLRCRPNPLRDDNLRPSSRSAGWGILTPFPSATAFALALGARLTLRGLTLRRNPWTFGVRGSHPHLRYSCQHSHFRCLHKARAPASPAYGTLRYRVQKTEIRNQGSEPPRRRPPQHAGNLADTLPASARRHHSRYSRDPGNRAPTPGSRPRSRSPSSGNGRIPARDMRCRPKPSARLAQIDLDARRIWSANARCSIAGNSRLARCTSSDNRYARRNTRDPRPARPIRSFPAVLVSAVLIF